MAKDGDAPNENKSGKPPYNKELGIDILNFLN